jgi:hypothetical protein
VAAGGAHALAALLNGGVRAWGSRGAGQLGNGIPQIARFSPFRCTGFPVLGHINDRVNRIYQGLDPSVFPMMPGGLGQVPQPMQDSVEVIRFSEPGRYLVICGVLPHFYDAATGQFIMYGYVRVQP